MKVQSDVLSLGIVGCGWLGQAIAQQAMQQGIKVVATTQSADKQALLQKEGIDTHLLALPFVEKNFANNRVFDCDLVVICITPQIRQGKKDYPEKVKQLVMAAQQGKAKRLVLISTTAAYEGLTGEVNELSELCLENEKVALINAAEQQVLSFSKNSIVMRCAGLVGPNRHPGKFFNINRPVKSGNAYVNLVHQYDVVQLLILLSSTNLGGIFNCVSDMKVDKKQFYQQAAIALDKPSPEFEQGDSSTGRLVVGHLLRDKLNYQYRYDDLIAWMKGKVL